MKYLPWLFLTLLVPRPALATGVVGVYADQTGQYCLLVDIPATKTLYVMQRFSVGSTASRFRVEYSPGFTGVLASVSAPYGTMVGDPLTGVTVTYDNCLIGDISALELQFMMLGTSEECSWIRTAAHPLSIDGMIDVYDCISGRAPAVWQGTHVQQDGNRLCPDLYPGDGHLFPPCNPYTPPLATEGATWGAVKSLYR